MLVKDTNAEYNLAEGIRSTFLKTLRKSPLNAFSNNVEEKEKDSFKEGRLYHTFFLEPEIFNDVYQIYDESDRPFPEKNYQLKANKVWRDEQKDKAFQEGKEIVSINEYNDLLQMREAILKFAPAALNLMAISEREKSLYTELTLAGGDKLKAKVRFDCINIERGAILDLKTTKDATPDGFSKEAGNYAYHIQAAYYLRLAETVFNKPFKFFILAQEKKAPFNVSLREVSDSMRQKGDFELDKLLEAANYIQQTGDISSYDIFSDNELGIIPLDIPDYFVQKYDFNFKLKTA